MPWLPEQVSRPWGALLLGAPTGVKGREAAGSEDTSCCVTYSDPSASLLGPQSDRLCTGMERPLPSFAAEFW